MKSHGMSGRFMASLLVAIALLAATSGVSSAQGDQAKPVVYLTFDDGPALDSATGSLLELLAAEGVTATFFVVGSNVDRNPQMINRIVAGGHALGNHSYRHQALDQMSADQIRADLVNNQLAVDRAGGPQMTCYRPPFGLTNDLVRSVGASLGMSEELWTFNFQDWERLDPRGYAEQLRRVGNGDVVLLHDGFVDGENTVEAMRQFLREEGDEIDFRALPGCLSGQPTTTTTPSTTTPATTTPTTTRPTTTTPTTAVPPTAGTVEPLGPTAEGSVAITPPCRLGPIDDLLDTADEIEGAVFRLYCSHLGRHPDSVGFAYWLNTAASARSLYPLSYSFLVSDEFVGTYGDLDETEFLDTVYLNVLGRSPDAAGRAYWLATLQSGVSRSMVMLSFSESAEFRLATGTI